jgi:hypothetical protein
MIRARLLLLVALPLLHCGYSTRSLLPSHLHTVGIEAVENLTLQPELTDVLQTALQDEFTRDRNLRVTAIEQADIDLKVQLVSYFKEADAYTGDQRVSSYRIAATASLNAQDKVRDELLYSGVVTAQVSFDPSATTEEETGRTLMAKLAKEAVRVLLLAW